MSEGDLSPVRRSAWREAPLDQVNPQRRLVPAGPNGPIFSLNGKTERAEMRMAECCSARGKPYRLSGACLQVSLVSQDPRFFRKATWPWAGDHITVVVV